MTIGETDSADETGAEPEGWVAIGMLYVTAPSEEILRKIGREAIEEKLAACVNIWSEVVSIYEWQGQISEDHEAAGLFKTSISSIPELQKFIKKRHPYEVPCTIAVRHVATDEPYGNWLLNQLRSCPSIDLSKSIKTEKT